jgi:hypothetical protein
VEEYFGEQGGLAAGQCFGEQGRYAVGWTGSERSLRRGLDMSGVIVDFAFCFLAFGNRNTDSGESVLLIRIFSLP